MKNKKKKNKNRKGIRRVLFIVISVFVLYISNIWYSFNICIPPNRPFSVPENAVWSGGPDGGNWFDLVETRGDTLRFRIYFDNKDGNFLADADFVIKKEDDLTISMDNWKEYSFFWSGTSLYVYNNQTDNNLTEYRLNPAFPAYAAYWDEFSVWDTVSHSYIKLPAESLENENKR